MRSAPAWRMFAATSWRKPAHADAVIAWGIGGGRPQFWPVGRERIGRRADRGAAREAVRVRPGLGAVRRGADREVAKVAPREAAGAGAVGRGGQLAIGEPLQVEREADPVRVPSGEVGDPGGGRPAQVDGPAVPGLARMRGGDRLEQRELPQRRPAGGDEAIELGHPRIVARAPLELREARVQHGPLGLPDARVVDELARGERREPGAGCARAAGARRPPPRLPAPRRRRRRSDRESGDRTGDTGSRARGPRRTARAAD